MPAQQDLARPPARTPSYRRLQQYAITISIISIIYCAAEGAVSIALGAKSDSRSLVFFGIQSGIEVISASFVLWRFRTVAKPGEERGVNISARELRFEKISSVCIAVCLVFLALGALATAISGLVLHAEPDPSNSSLVVAASALVLMILLWLPKIYLAKALDSSAMQAETKCSLSCIEMTLVLFVGALVYRVWKGGWWVDSATCIVLAAMFGWEGYKMLRWAGSKDFNGGCCDHLGKAKTQAGCTVDLAEQKKDLCECCYEKAECRESEECICDTLNGDEESACCKPVNDDGTKCCSREYVTGIVRHKEEHDVHLEDDCCGDSHCQRT